VGDLDPPLSTFPVEVDGSYDTGRPRWRGHARRGQAYFGNARREEGDMTNMRAVGWAQSFPIAGGVAAGRDWTREHLASLPWTKDAPDTVDDVLLTVSELITNAHVHAGSTAELVLAWDSRCLTVHVGDTDPGLPAAQRDDGSLAPSGRGLAIVDAVADEWSACPAPHGKAIVACFHPPSFESHSSG